MNAKVTFGPAGAGDLDAIVKLLADDILGAARENAAPDLYRRAFDEIQADPNQLLVVGRHGHAVVATLQLTFIPCLTHGATTRAQIESVRVTEDHRGQGVGEAMCMWAIDRAVERGCGVVQLTTDHQRNSALRFYERLGFVHSHSGLKLWLPNTGERRVSS